MAMALHVQSFFYFLFATITVAVMFSAAPSVSQPQAAGSCNGIFLSYVYTGGSRLPPNVSDPAEQPYRFSSTLTVLNNGLEELKAWRVFVRFQHGEWLVSASNAVLADGTSLPGSVENGTVLSGATLRDLKTAVATAGDLNQMQVQVEMLGTLLGVAPPAVPMPSSVTLANDGFVCGQLSGQGSNETHVCCTSDPNFKTNITTEEEFQPRQKGDLSITYDIIRTYDSDYWAEVTIANHNPLGRLDNWRLSWDWENSEFIYTLKGAYPLNVDSSDCVFGEQGVFYKELDFANVMNCERRPTVVDLPPTMFNNTDFGMVPFCCRNGTILPPTMDPSLSSSRFQMHVFKMPPNLNRSNLAPPRNWEIKGTLNPDYACGNPIRVSPSESPDPAHPPSNKSAIASWQVVCNITNTIRKCCVSFSAYYNDSAIPCSTCACGCPSNPERTCSATSQAMLLQPESLLVPFENRTEKTLAWADLKHLPVPNPMPCGDNCGVSINWHVATDHRNGWTARVTLFNWGETSFADWFAAVEMDKAAKGFEEVYSFNGSVLESVDDHDDTIIFMQGKEGLNFLVAETDGSNPRRDPRVPGKQQSVISFTKKNTPGINVVAGDGFPSKVFFNGEECSLPSVLPSSGTRKEASLSTTMFLVLFFSILFMCQW